MSFAPPDHNWHVAGFVRIRVSLDECPNSCKFGYNETSLSVPRGVYLAATQNVVLNCCSTFFREFAMLRNFCFLLVTVCFLTPSLAEKNVTIQPKTGPVASPSVTQAFDSELAKPLTVVKGEWKVVDEVLVGKELKSDKHAAVLNYQKSNRNSVVRFSFKLDGETKGFSFSLNHAKGHLFRVNVTPVALTVNLDKDKNDPTAKSVVLGTAKGKFEHGKWYTMQVEMLGEKVVAQTDNGLSVEATHASLDTDKPNYRFVVKGDSLLIDDLRIWELK